MEVKMTGACSTHERDENCVQNFNWKFWKEESTLKTSK